MKILVFGATGQVATELTRRADVIALDRAQANLADPVACAEAIHVHGPDAVINAAAYTAVDAAEEDEALASTINADAPGAMAQAAAVQGIPFVHVSTDYVFSGHGTTPWRESDPVAPQSAYGRTKLAGERAVRDAGGNTAILRTSWVFSAHGNNFVKTMLRLSKTRDALTIVADQIGGPTPAGDIAETLMTMAQAMAGGQAGGLYHYSGAPDISWAGFAHVIFNRTGRSIMVKDIPSSDYPTPAARPLNSRLDCTAIAADFGIARPNWCIGLDHVLKDLES